MAKVKGICKLCLKEDFLCESHVIPEYFFKGMYNEKHQALAISATPYSERFLQKGFYDRLLCKSCEHYLNTEFETYVIGIWQTKFPGIDHGIGYELSGLDYKRFKLFHLSILWKASVSSRETFKNVTLGPHEENLRKMILKGEPGSPTDYPVFGKVQELGGQRIDYTFDPQYGRLKGHRTYIFDFGSCVWYYLVTSHDLGDLGRYCLRSNGTLLFPKIDFWADKRWQIVTKAAERSNLYKPGGWRYNQIIKQ